MKRIFLAIISVLAFATQVTAQKFIDIYKDGKVTGSMFSADIDSVSITGSDAFSRRINFWGAGRIANSFYTNSLDSIKVFRSEDEPLVYLGILGFNQELYPKSIDILASSTSGLYTSFVSNLSRKDGTLLYYGVDQALDILSHYNFTTPLSSVNLITFTDGLDQGSLMMNSDYVEDETYLSALNQRIESMRVRGLPLTAYSLGLLGNDVTNHSLFQSNLRKLATSEDKASEVSNMDDVQNRLQEIADQIISISNRQTVSMKIPGQGNGTRVCFTFDGEEPNSSAMYIEGTFNLADRSLRNVSYHGLRAANGSVIYGTQEGIFVTFTFTGLQRTDGNGLIPMNAISQYNQTKGSATWQINSEFSSANNTQTTISHSGAAIMLVLDCSSSLGSKFRNMQSYAQDFIKHIARNAASFNLNAPTNVSAKMDEEDFAIKVNWNAVKYAESYSVYRSNYSNSHFIKVADNVTKNSWFDIDPNRGDNYYRICAEGHGLTSSHSNSSNVVKCEISAPQNVVAIYDENEMVVNVSWDAVKYAEYYSVYRSMYPDKDFILVADSITSTSWQDESPSWGDNYYCIYAKGHDLVSLASNSSNNVKYENVVIDANCAEIITGANGRVYRTEGIVSEITNTTYGNWYLQDETGKIFIYGTLDANGATRNFSSLCIEVGDSVKVEGPKMTYNGRTELYNVTVLKIVKSLIKITTDDIFLSKDGGEFQVKVAYKGDDCTVSVPKEYQSWISYIKKENTIGVPTSLETNPADTTIVTFMCAPNKGKIRTATVEFRSANSGDESSATYKISQETGLSAFALPYAETFLSNGIGEFTVFEIIPRPDGTSIWFNDPKYGMVAKAGSAIDTKALLISPKIDLRHAETPVLTFEHTGKYVSDMYYEQTLWASTDGGKTWTQLLIPNYPTYSDWDFVRSGNISLKAFVGQIVIIAFQYISTTTDYSTWEIKNVKIKDTQ